jgi:hypothetical protein
MVGLLEQLFAGVYYLTPERARPWRVNDTNSGEAQSWRGQTFTIGQYVYDQGLSQRVVGADELFVSAIN